ncbi:MAG: FtsX-like permease family protein [Actinobacteria bacterium]|nr:FtsX-like permease family protein [Actinomycetota bacterium]
MPAQVKIHHREPWQAAAAIAVFIGVFFSVLLMSVAFGVAEKITHLVDNPNVEHTQAVNTALVEQILTVLTIVVVAAMLSQTAAATFTLGVTVMRNRREEIAVRRQSGVLRSRLLREFLIAMFYPCLIGGLVGEALGILAAGILRQTTVLPVAFNLVSLLAAFPVTIVLALAATLLPAWRSTNISPAMLRKG